MLIKRLQGQFEKRNGYYYEYDLHSKPLGEGGMGVVYKGFKIYEATGTRSLVAIKAMFDGLPTEVYERAEREASIRLRNDNLIEMLGFISDMVVDPYGIQKRRYYVVSEYLNGVVLSDLLKGQIKDNDGVEFQYAKQLYAEYIADREKTSVKIIRCILSGVLALHDNGYIHRDIDPTNIMVTDAGTIKLIDFGIAKYVRSLGTADKSLTTSGKFVGKAEFASPELVLGDVRNQGYPTDIYAIGILFYQLLVGRLPFTGSKYEVLQMQLNNKVPVRQIDNQLLRKVVKKATEKNKSDRYPSVIEFRVDLNKAIDSPSRIITRYWKHSLAVLVSGVACAVLIFWMNSKKETEIAPRLSSVDEREILLAEFNIALEKLNSSDGKTASEGLSLMERLADDNYSAAKRELGMTYCTFTKVLPPQIKARRTVLGINHDSSTARSIKYLESVKTDTTMSGRALYMLGYSYWKQHKWAEGYETLSKALLRISHSTDGDADLREDIKRYKDLCEKQLKN